MALAPDKIAHIKAGALVAAFGAALGAAIGGLMGYTLHLNTPSSIVLLLVCIGAAAFAACASAGLTKEHADAADNRIYPGMHGVEAADAIATTAPGALVCMVCLVLAILIRQGVLPWA